MLRQLRVIEVREDLEVDEPQALTAGGFTELGQLAAQPVAATAVYYGAGYEAVAADVAALLGIPATQVLPAAGVPGV